MGAAVVEIRRDTPDGGRKPMRHARAAAARRPGGFGMDIS
jgi:hypothetical protein